MNIQTKAVNQAIATLKAVGAVFAVRYDGVEYGNAKLEEEKVKPVRTVKHRWEHIYGTWLNTCKPGDVFEHVLPSLDQARSLQGSLSGQLSHHYGLKTYMTTLETHPNGYKVSALYVGKNETAAT
jgi:hypothetical protein